MMNKVLELIEVFKLFPFDPNKYEIVIHPQSLIHAIVFFKNGQRKFLYHETDMRIPIANAIFENDFDISKLFKIKNSLLNNFNKLKLEKVDKKRFPIVTLASKYFKVRSGPIILNASNEVLVAKFINKEISFKSIYLLKLFYKDFKKYAIKRRQISKIYIKLIDGPEEKLLKLLKE